MGSLCSQTSSKNDWHLSHIDALAAQVVYQDRRKIENMVKRSLPMMKNFKDFEFGFKIRDKTRPNDWYFAENVTIIPPESELKGTVADQVSDWWKGITGNKN